MNPDCKPKNVRQMELNRHPIIIFETKNRFMNRIILAMVCTALTMSGHSRNFSGEEDHKETVNIVVANPTVHNMEIIHFLADRKILKVNARKVRFTGVYHKNQAYDFSASHDYVREHPEAGFTLVEITDDLPDSVLFRENSCTSTFREIFRNSDAVFFLGGPDIQPLIYGEENTHSVVTDPGRHSFEVSLLFHLLGGAPDPAFRPFLEEKPQYVVTGFCLGLQTMNVAAGGTLYQDIPAQLYGKKGAEETLQTDRENLHRNYWQLVSDDKQLMGINIHPVRFTSHPFFPEMVKVRRKEMPFIYSSHHQSPALTGSGFEVTALSPDGKVIEGLAHNRFPHVFGVQFHPEVPALYEKREPWKFAPDDEPQTLHEMIGRKSVRFHKKYWKYISGCIERSQKQFTGY